MKVRTAYAILFGLSMLFASSHSFADDNVCVINNSSQDINASAGEGPVSNGSFSIGAHGGDQNQCWSFQMGLTSAHYSISIDSDEGTIWAGFTNPSIGAGYFNPSLTSTDEWGANNKMCQGSVCIWHAGAADVWRLYVEDAPAPYTPGSPYTPTNCKSLLDPECEM